MNAPMSARPSSAASPFVAAQGFKARPVSADQATLDAYFTQVASYEAHRLHGAQRAARIGFVVGAIGTVVGLLGVGAVTALAPLKRVEPLVFRVSDTTGVVERVYDLRGGTMEATEASTRFFLWQYVRLRQTYSAAEAKSNFEAVALMSSPAVQTEFSAQFRGANPTSPQVVLGRDGTASLRWVSTTFLSPALAQVRFVQTERKRDTPLPDKHLVATLGFRFAPGELTASHMNVNPLGFIVTSYRADTEVTP